MEDAASRATVRPIAIVGHPLYSIFLPMPVLCFIGALITDLSYWGSGGNLIWLNFSSWLITAGLVFGAIVAMLLVIELARSARLRRGAGWAHFGLFLAAWIVELINALVHARDGWTAVVPLGLTLSVISVLLVLVGGWLWQSIRYRAEEVRP